MFIWWFQHWSRFSCNVFLQSYHRLSRNLFLLEQFPSWWSYRSTVPFLPISRVSYSLKKCFLSNFGIVFSAKSGTIEKVVEEILWRIHFRDFTFILANYAYYKKWMNEFINSSKMPKMVQFGDFLTTWSLRSNSVTR